MEQTRTSTIGLPRAVLVADGAFCALYGAVTAFGAGPISDLAGLEGATLLIAGGAALFLYGAWLMWEATRRPVERWLVLLVALLNIAWVAGEILILTSGVPALTAEGRWVVGVTAVVVALFAEAQFYAYWRMRRMVA